MLFPLPKTILGFYLLVLSKSAATQVKSDGYETFKVEKGLYKHC